MTEKLYPTDFRALCAELVDVFDNPSPPQYKADVLNRARDTLAQALLEQSDETLKFIRKNTPRYRMSVTISTYDSTIDTRMPVIWSALDLNREILESVSLPEQLPPLGNK